MLGSVGAETQNGIVPEAAKTPYYPALDGMRAIAVLMVMVTHFLPKRLPFGWMGVQIFFVLSGFLITGILFDTRVTKHRWRDFYVRRALRIFPLYYGLVVLVLLVIAWTRSKVPGVFSLWLFYGQNFFWAVDKGLHNDALLTSNGHLIAIIGHLWSLAVEEQFYLVWPVVVFLVKGRARLMRVCVGLVALRLVGAFVWQHHLSQTAIDNGLLYRMLPTQSDAFLLGGLLALWLRGKPSERVQRYSGRLAVIGLCFYVALLAGLRGHESFTGGDLLNYRSSFQVVIGIPLANFVAMLMILAAIQPGSWLFRICHLPLLRSLGRVSYGLYVYHLTAYWWCEDFCYRLTYGHGIPRAAGAVQSAAGFAATAALAYASFYGYERRFLLLKNRFSSVRGEAERAAVAHPV